MLTFCFVVKYNTESSQLKCLASPPLMWWRKSKKNGNHRAGTWTIEAYVPLTNKITNTTTMSREKEKMFWFNQQKSLFIWLPSAEGRRRNFLFFGWWQVMYSARSSPWRGRRLGRGSCSVASPYTLILDHHLHLYLKPFARLSKFLLLWRSFFISFISPIHFMTMGGNQRNNVSQGRDITSAIVSRWSCFKFYILIHFFVGG